MGRRVTKAIQKKVNSWASTGLPAASVNRYKANLAKKHAVEKAKKKQERKQIAQVTQTRKVVQNLDDRVLAQALIQDKAEQCLAQGDAMTTDVGIWAVERKLKGIN